MTAAAIQGTFATFKAVPTRSVFQLIIEIPSEGTMAALTALGCPQPGEGIWVTVARLDAGSSKGKTADFESADAGSSPAPAAKRAWHELSRAAQAGIRCGEREFQEWATSRLGNTGDVFGVTETAVAVRALCHVNSRAEFDTLERAGKRWDALDTEYLQAMGRMAEDRSG